MAQHGAAVINHLRKKLLRSEVSVVGQVGNVERNNKVAVSPAKPEHKRVTLAHNMIHFDIALIIIVVVFRIQNVIICNTWKVWFRIESQKLLHDGIQSICRDAITFEWLPNCSALDINACLIRIKNGRKAREIAVTHRTGWHCEDSG